MVDHLLEEEKNRLLREHLLGTLICQVLDKESLMSELVFLISIIALFFQGFEKELD